MGQDFSPTAISRISSREDVVKIIRLLALDAEHHSDEWNHVEIHQFLEALAAWLEDMDGFFESQNQEAPLNASWQLFAQALVASKSYE